MAVQWSDRVERSPFAGYARLRGGHGRTTEDRARAARRRTGVFEFVMGGVAATPVVLALFGVHF